VHTLYACGRLSVRGLEINTELVAEAQLRLRATPGCPVGEGAYEVVNQDLMDADLSSFSVIFNFLLPWSVDMLAEKMASAICDCGARVVSYMWPIDFGAKSKQIQTTCIGETEHMFLYQRRPGPESGRERAQ
jgi:hypothetical protein